MARKEQKKKLIKVGEDELVLFNMFWNGARNWSADSASLSE
jgi:hypothetical protein